jgi:hypothetical protein
MGNDANSLRSLVDKWFAPNSAVPLRVTRFRLNPTHERYVRIEAKRSSGAVAIFFFLHGDGTWCVFPPEAKRPAMSAVQTSLSRL